MDFSAFYTAGQSLNEGLSPYVNYVTQYPHIWDGVATFEHSRFLYPPLAASFFQPLALVPYSIAKSVWMVISLGSLALSTAVFCRMTHFRPSAVSVLLLILFVVLFHPLLTLLERGQIDALTLVPIAIAAMLSLRKDMHLSAGILLSLAAVMKLHCVLFLPFLAVSRRWTSLLGFAVGCLVLLAASLVISGPELTTDYVVNQLPRIARYGEGGTAEMKIETSVLPLVDAPATPSNGVHITQKNGLSYADSSFAFYSEASLARVLSRTLELAGIALPPSVISVALATLFALPLVRMRAGLLKILSPGQEIAYWQYVLAAVLLSSPLTWVMNTVWLIPAAVLVLRNYAGLKTVRQAVFLAVCTLGLLLAAFPDSLAFPLAFPYLGGLTRGKYVVAEALVLASAGGILGCWGDGPILAARRLLASRVGPQAAPLVPGSGHLPDADLLSSHV